MFRRGEVLKSPPQRNKSSGQIKARREGPNTYITNQVSPSILNEISDHFPEYTSKQQAQINNFSEKTNLAEKTSLQIKGIF
jgi:hypothetical protein